MAEVLEVLQLANQDCVAQMDVGSCRVESRLDPQRNAGLRGAFELRVQLFNADRFFRSLSEIGELFVQSHFLNPAGCSKRIAMSSPAPSGQGCARNDEV